MKQRNALHCNANIWPVFMRPTHIQIYRYTFGRVDNSGRHQKQYMVISHMQVTIMVCIITLTMPERFAGRAIERIDKLQR